MKHFTRSKLAVAVALAIGVGISTQASAQVLDAQQSALSGAPAWTNGDLGDYLIFPYYNIREGNTHNGLPAGKFNTSFTVTNTDTNHAVLAKVRIYDYQLCQDVLDFQIFMSPGDEVVGVIRDDGNGRVEVDFGNDMTCRIPWNNGSATVGGAAPQNPATGAALEGMMEIIPMAAFPVNINPPSSGPSLVGKLAVHGAGQNCARLSGTLEEGHPTGAQGTYNLEALGKTAKASRVGNWLRGGFTVANLAGGYSGGGKALAIANMDDPIDVNANGVCDNAGGGDQCGGPFLLGQNYLGLPVNLTAQWNAVNDISENGTIAYATNVGGQQWFAPDMRFMRPAAGGLDLALGAGSIINNWSVNTASNANIDWVVSYITDKLHRGARVPAFCSFPLNSGSSIWDREEHRARAPLGGVSPGTPNTATLNLCNCVNVIGFQTSTSLTHADNWTLRNGGSSVIDLGNSLPADFGWANLQTAPAAGLYATSGFGFTLRAPNSGDPHAAIANVKPHDMP